MLSIQCYFPEQFSQCFQMTRKIQYQWVIITTILWSSVSFSPLSKPYQLKKSQNYALKILKLTEATQASELPALERVVAEVLLQHGTVPPKWSYLSKTLEDHKILARKALSLGVPMVLLFAHILKPLLNYQGRHRVLHKDQVVLACQGSPDLIIWREKTTEPGRDLFYLEASCSSKTMQRAECWEVFSVAEPEGLWNAHPPTRAESRTLQFLFQFGFYLETSQVKGTINQSFHFFGVSW